MVSVASRQGISKATKRKGIFMCPLSDEVVSSVRKGKQHNHR